jgi:hypothetical protein
MKKLFLFMTACACAQINRPQLGTMLDSSGGARAVFGLPGSLGVASPSTAGVVSLGCAASCLVKTDSSLVTSGQTIAAPAGNALFAFDSSGAFVYFPREKRLARWQSGQLTPVPFQVTGEIIGLRSVNGTPQFAVRFIDQIQIVGDGNTVVYQFPPGAQSVMLLPAGAIYSSTDAIHLWRTDASEMTFPLAGATGFVAMSQDYFEIFASGAHYALRITPGREQLFQLPEPQQ